MLRALLPLLALSFAPAAHAGWSDDVQRAVDACNADPAPCDAVDQYTPYRARNGGLRFRATPDLEDPSTHPILLHRLNTETDPAMRLAYADLLARLMRETSPQWHPAWIHLAAHDPDDAVRHAMIVGLRRAPIEVAAPGLRAAFAHENGPTRALAVFEMGGHAEAATFLREISKAFGDGHPDVRTRAAQVAGWLGSPELIPGLLELLNDRDGEVRGFALLSLLALDPDRARSEANRFDGDSHPRVRAAMRAISRHR